MEATTATRGKGHEMKNCTITIDVTGFGYTYLLQLESMISEFLEDGNNENELDELHAWMMDNARNFADDARAAGDTLAADIFSDMAEANEELEEDGKIILDANEYDGARLNAIIERKGYDALALNVYDPGTRKETVEVTGADRAAAVAAYEAEANETPEDTRTGAELYADLLVQAFLDAPENSILDKTVGAAAREARDFPNDLYRAGYFDGMAELVAKMICLRNDFQDIPTLKAAIYKAYQVAR